MDNPPFGTFGNFAAIALAGGAGGVIRWWSVTGAKPDWWRAAANWITLLGHIVAGAIAGTFLHGIVFGALKPIADLTSMDPFDAKLLGAHMAGTFGLNLYTIPGDFIRKWMQVTKASSDKDTGP